MILGLNFRTDILISGDPLEESAKKQVTLISQLIGSRGRES